MGVGYYRSICALNGDGGYYRSMYPLTKLQGRIGFRVLV